MEKITIKEVAEAMAKGQNVSLIFPRNMGRSWVMSECRKIFEKECTQECLKDCPFDHEDMHESRHCMHEKCESYVECKRYGGCKWFVDGGCWWQEEKC